MKVSVIQLADLTRKPIDISGALSIEIELDNGDRYSISLSTEDYINLHSVGDKIKLQIEPRAANAIHIRAS